MQESRNSYFSNIHEPLTQQIIDTGVNSEIKAISQIQSSHFSFEFASRSFQSDKRCNVQTLRKSWKNDVRKLDRHLNL